MKLKKIALYSIIYLFLFLIVSYFCLIFVLPEIIHSKFVTGKIKDEIYKRSGIKIETEGFNFDIHKNLKVDISCKILSAHYKNNKEFFLIRDVDLKFEQLKYIPNNIQVDYIFFSKPEFDKINIPKKTKKSSSKQKISNIPYIKVNKADLLLLDNGKDKLFVSINNTKFIPVQKGYIVKLSGKIDFNHWHETIPITIKGSFLNIKKSLVTKDLQIKTKLTDMSVNGKIADANKNYDFNVKANNLSIKILKDAFLILMKYLNPNDKNFIENFYDFNGLADMNLSFSPKNISGNIITHNLSAKTVKFSIPVVFPYVDFSFDEDDVYAKAFGTFGNEKVYSDLVAKDIFDNDRIVIGNVVAKLGSKFAKLYIPDADIDNHINASVKYVVQHRKPVVEYEAKIPVGSNIHYKSGDLGLLEDDRRIYAKTIKIGNEIFLDTYDYSVVKGNLVDRILFGDGKFIKDKGKYRLDYITGHTDGDAPVSLTGSFGRYVRGGTFNGNLRYDYKKEIITGNFNLKNSRYKAFYVNEAYVNANDSTMVINANGTYDNAKYTGYINMVNSFKDKITIHNIDLYLERFVLRKYNSKRKRKFALKIPPKTQKIDWRIEKGKIKLDKFLFEKVLIENIELTGNLKNNIVDVSMPDIDFAKRKLSAKGTYDISTHSADAYFSGKNIDSNLAADMILNLHEQVEGKANADMHIITKNKLQTIDAHTDFSISEGALPKLADKEFIVKKSKKSYTFKLPDVIKFDKKKVKFHKANINGSLDLHNDIIRNVELYSKHKYFSVFIEGQYNISNQNTEVYIWGKFNKNAQKGIKIFFVPLSWITKFAIKTEKTTEEQLSNLKKVPPIEAEKNEITPFVVKVKGNINENSKLKYELRRLK